MFAVTSSAAAFTATQTIHRRLRAPIAVALAAASLSVAGADTAAAAPTQCSPDGRGRFNCQFYPRASPVQASDRRQVGTLHAGTNWVICQRIGGTVTSGPYFNRNWALTVADNNASGWVNAVWAKGGANNEGFGGVPQCSAERGTPPGGDTPGTSPGPYDPPPCRPHIGVTHKQPNRPIVVGGGRFGSCPQLTISLWARSYDRTEIVRQQTFYRGANDRDLFLGAYCAGFGWRTWQTSISYGSAFTLWSNELLTSC